jgi:tetratricopeptide (TPR) repeat protein
MVVRFLLFFSVVIFSACSSSPDSKGENIPDQQVIQLGQNASKNVQFLTLQLADQPSANLYYLRAKNYLILHAYGLADQDMEKALRDNPGEPAYLALSARIKQLVEDYATSIDRAKLTEASEFNSLQNTLLLAQNYFITNQNSLGRFYLKKINSSYLPGKDRALYKAVKDFAVSDSARLFTLMNSKPSDDSPLVYIYYEQGLKTISTLRYQQEILGSWKKFPLDPYFMRFWARFLVKMKKYDQAALVYKQLLQAFPRTKTLQAELVYFDLAKQGKLPLERRDSTADSTVVEKDSLPQN